MQWEFIVALVIAIPVILFPAAFVWYLNASGLYQVIRDTWEKRARERKLARMLRQAMVQMLAETLVEVAAGVCEAVFRADEKVIVSAAARDAEGAFPQEVQGCGRRADPQTGTKAAGNLVEGLEN